MTARVIIDFPRTVIYQLLFYVYKLKLVEKFNFGSYQWIVNPMTNLRTSWIELGQFLQKEWLIINVIKTKIYFIH
jgi:hypothetical protein